jgi:VWFA-related protein
MARESSRSVLKTVRRVLAAGLALGWALVAPASTSAQAPTALDVAQVIATAYPEVTAVVSVRDASGTPLGGLNAAAFSASEDGAAAQVLDVQAAVDTDVGMAVVMVMDTSGSMAGAPLATTQEAAVAFVDSLLPNDKATVIAFADSVGPPSELTGDKQALASVLRGLEANGSTALYDAVVAGVRAAGAAPLPRKVVVLLTDGQDYGALSSATLEDSLAEAGTAGIPIFTIGVGEDVNVPYLQEVAQRSGGRFLAAPAPADIPAVYEGIGRLLRAQYLLRLRLPGQADGGESELRVSVSDGGATVEGTSRFRRPGAAPQPIATPTREATATPVAENEGGGRGPFIWVMIVVLLLLLGGGGGVLGFRRARRGRAAASGPTKSTASYRPPPVAEWAGPEAPSARLVVIEGPDAGRRVDLGERAVTIGADADCALRLSDAGGQVGGRHARVWLREGSFMLHHLDRRLTTRVGERTVDWAVLEPGDEIAIGPHRIRFEAASEANS